MAGLTSSYDYGPLGAQLLKNIRDAWWHTFVESRPDMVGLDSQILLHPQTWVASGHVSSFNDPLVEDVKTHKRYRADHLLEGWLKLQESHLLNSLAKRSKISVRNGGVNQKIPRSQSWGQPGVRTKTV